MFQLFNNQFNIDSEFIHKKHLLTDNSMCKLLLSFTFLYVFIIKNRICIFSAPLGGTRCVTCSAFLFIIQVPNFILTTVG